MLGALALNKYTMALAGLVGVVVVLTTTFYLGKGAGEREAAAEALARTVKVMQEREVIDEKVSRSTASELCGSFGLSDADRQQCVRRVEETQSKPGDIGPNSNSRPAIRQSGGRP